MALVPSAIDPHQGAGNKKHQVGAWCSLLKNEPGIAHNTRPNLYKRNRGGPTFKVSIIVTYFQTSGHRLDTVCCSLRAPGVKDLLCVLLTNSVAAFTWIFIGLGEAPGAQRIEQGCWYNVGCGTLVFLRLHKVPHS